MENHYYRVLGLQKGASLEEIKAAYRKYDLLAQVSTCALLEKQSFYFCSDYQRTDRYPRKWG